MTDYVIVICSLPWQQRAACIVQGQFQLFPFVSVILGYTRVNDTPCGTIRNPTCASARQCIVRLRAAPPNQSLGPRKINPPHHATSERDRDALAHSHKQCGRVYDIAASRVTSTGRKTARMF
jgi:hypothetical protein